MKTAYICGPLTDLSLAMQAPTKTFYVSIADALEKVHAGHRPFVPHEHCDPLLHASLTPNDVYAIEAEQVTRRTSVLVVVPVAPSWGGGMEVMMAHYSQVPIVVLRQIDLKVSRLLLGCPSIKMVITYDQCDEGVRMLANWYRKNLL